MTEQRFAGMKLGPWLGICGNAGLALAKAAAGLAGGSTALVADAAHTVTDMAGSVQSLLGMRGTDPAKEEKDPYARIRAESVGKILISILLMLFGIQIAIAAVKSLFYGVGGPPRIYVLFIVIFSILLKEGLFQYKYRLGKRLGSRTLVAHAWEHRSDVYSSLAALIGVGGALLGQWWGFPYLYYLDPAAGLFIVVLVLHMGYKLIMELLDHTLPPILREENVMNLINMVQRVPGVLRVDDLQAREQGHYVVVDVRISVNPRITVLEGQEIAKAVKSQLMERFIHISEVTIHVHPYDPGYPYKNHVNPEQDHLPNLLQ
jgi:cation diffusion facilitator family transporter